MTMNTAINENIDPKAGKRANFYDVEAIRADFPAMKVEVNGHPLTFLDSGASAQKPVQVLERMDQAYREEYANVHRGAYRLSELATENYENARSSVARFMNAASAAEIIFPRNATAAFNLVSSSWGRKNLRAGDEIVVSHMEHHANIVPWQLLRDETGIVIKVAPIDDDGNFLMDEFAALLGAKTKLVSITQTSNVLGTMTPIKEIARLAHEAGALVMFDGAQGIVHAGIDVQDVDADFYVFTGHKLYGPTGIGVLYGKLDILKNMPPYQGGGDMIEMVTFEKTTYREPPARFEAGTPPIIEAIGLAAAIDYVNSIGQEAIAGHEVELLNHATKALGQIDGLTIIGQARQKCAIVSFTIEGVHPHDIGTIIDARGVAIRAGHHCAQPLMDRFGLAATARASFGMYNKKEDVDVLVDALLYAKEIFA